MPQQGAEELREKTSEESTPQLPVEDWNAARRRAACAGCGVLRGGRCPAYVTWGTARAERRGCPYIVRSAGLASVEPFGSAAAACAPARSAAAAIMKTSFFHIIKTKTELIPLVGIISFAAIGAFSFSIYSLFCKSDVIINKSSNPEPWETVDATKPQKLLTIRQKWKPIEELESVKKLTK